jgi:ArsR family metal-binding transcriptional regulator
MNTHLIQLQEARLYFQNVVKDKMTPDCTELAEKVLVVLETLYIPFTQNLRMCPNSEKKIILIFDKIDTIKSFYRDIMKCSWSSRMYVHTTTNEDRAKEFTKQLDDVILQALVVSAFAKQKKVNWALKVVVVIAILLLLATTFFVSYVL